MPVVYVVDDDQSMRTALIRLLQASGFQAIGYASAGDFLMHGDIDEPSCLLLDVMMPGPSGLDLQAALLKQSVELPIIFMTGHADVASCASAMKSGAVDYLQKPIEPETLLEVVRDAMQRSESARALRAEREGLNRAFASLSARERQVFECIVTGKLNKQIACELQVAERTVKAERAALMRKLGTDSAAVLGRLAEKLSTTRNVGPH